MYCLQVYYELAEARAKANLQNVAIARVEQISPFPFDLVHKHADVSLKWSTWVGASFMCAPYCCRTSPTLRSTGSKRSPRTRVHGRMCDPAWQPRSPSPHSMPASPSRTHSDGNLICVLKDSLYSCAADTSGAPVRLPLPRATSTSTRMRSQRTSMPRCSKVAIASSKHLGSEIRLVWFGLVQEPPHTLTTNETPSLYTSPSAPAMPLPAVP